MSNIAPPPSSSTPAAGPTPRPGSSIPSASPQNPPERKKAFNDIEEKKKKAKRSYIIGGVILLLLIIGGSAGYWLTKQSQDVRQQASVGSYPSPTPTCTEECPGADGILRNCTPPEADGTPEESICNAAGRVESCGGTEYCCPAANGAWTTDMTACTTPLPDRCETCNTATATGACKEGLVCKQLVVEGQPQSQQGYCVTEAEEANVCLPSPSPSPSPTPTPSPSPSPSPSEEPSPSPTPTPTDSPTYDCNDSCSSNSQCQSTNSNYVCFQSKCRLDSNPTSTTCSDSTAATSPTTQPELPETLPESGSEDILNWLKAGMGVLGFGAVLLLLL